MNKYIEKIVLVVGGDLRQIYLADILSRNDNFKVYAIGFDKNIAPCENIELIDSFIRLKERVDYIILPLIASDDGVFVNTPFYKNGIALDSLIGVIKENGIIFGGRLSNMVKDIFTNHNIIAIDYFQREELMVLNAVPTAEGAIQIAMEELATTIFNQKVLIIGFGRIAKVLVKMLNGMGAKVTVSARNYADLAWVEIYGCESLHIDKLENRIGEYDIIFNTVPAVILTEEKLSKLKNNCLLIDLASKPGGVDFDTAGQLGIKTVWALSLPGKVAPITSGEIIARAIINILTERGEIYV